MSHPKPLNNRPGKILDHLSDVLEALDRTAEQIDRVNVIVDHVKQTLNELAQTNPEIDALIRPANSKSRQRNHDAAAPLSFANSITLKPGQHSTLAVIDGHSLTLSPKLGALLEILLADDGPTNTNGNGWKSREELTRRLSLFSKSLVTRHSLENLLSRLRKAFQRQARLGALLQCDRRLGVRLALYKYVAAAANGSNNAGNAL